MQTIHHLKARRKQKCAYHNLIKLCPVDEKCGCAFVVGHSRHVEFAEQVVAQIAVQMTFVHDQQTGLGLQHCQIVNLQGVSHNGFKWQFSKTHDMLRSDSSIGEFASAVLHIASVGHGDHEPLQSPVRLTAHAD